MICIKPYDQILSQKVFCIACSERKVFKAKIYVEKTRPVFWKPQHTVFYTVLSQVKAEVDQSLNSTNDYQQLMNPNSIIILSSGNTYNLL